MEKYFFTKMSGAGNDFILFDREVNPRLHLKPGIIRKLCDRRNGIGADGVITITDNKKLDFEMEYFNADGSTGSLCGNGSRCAIKFAEITGRIKNGIASFVSNKKYYSGKIIDGNHVSFFLNSPEDLRLEFTLSAFGHSLKANFINTGSPHVVIDINNILKKSSEVNPGYENINEVPVIGIGREIRYLKEFAPEGTNVNFMTLENKKILIRTYERGVEDETLSCGTGAVATAIIASINYGIKPPVNLLTHGGDILTVDFERRDKKLENLSLTGPVKIVFTGEVQGTIFV
jgi:diaminopimelate epimerase